MTTRRTRNPFQAVAGWLMDRFPRPVAPVEPVAPVNKSYWPAGLPRPVPGQPNTPDQSRAIVEALDARKLEEQIRCGSGNGPPVDPSDASYWPRAEGVPQRPGAAPYGDVT